jgi:hypothetical protein
MKYIFTFTLFFSLLNADLFAQAGKQKVIEVSLTSFGETGDIKYTFQKERFLEQKTASGIKDSSIREIKNLYWEKIIEVVKEVELDSLTNIKAPANLREVDGDWHSFITIITKSQKYRTLNFDSSTPDNELFKIDSILWATGNKLSTISWDSLYNLREEEKIDLIYQFVEEPPTFKGSQDSLSTYINTRLRENGINSGKALVRCVVRKDGQLSNIELLKADNDVIGQTALNIVKAMPNWKAGKNRGESVNVQVVIPFGYD